MNEKAIQGLLNASPEKRYKSFLTTAADLAEVWLLSSEEGYATFDADGYIHLLIWPRREFAVLLQSAEEEPVSMEIHDFIEECQHLDSHFRFMVFPTQNDAYVVTTKQLCEDLADHLEEVE